MTTNNSIPPVKYFLIVLLLILSCSSAFAQKTEVLLDKYLDAYYSAKGIPSVCAGALVNGKLSWTKGVGYSDIENSVKATPKTIYRLASVSKPITALAIMQLVEKGKIKLDDDIRQHVPYFPKKKWNVTIRQILTHTSGIRTYKPGEFDNTNNFQTIKDAILVYANDSLDMMPGTKYNYNTISYNLLAAVIENVSGLSFGEYLKKNIFEPAGMTSTKLELQAEIVPFRARGYVKNGDTVKNAPLADLSFKYAGGGMISSIEDLLKLGKAILEHKIISQASINTMCSPTFLPSGERIDYGLGFGFGIDSLKRKYFGHAGGGTGFSSHLVIFPDSNAVFAYLINARDNNLENPALDIANLVLSHEDKEAVLNKYIQKFSKK